MITTGEICWNFFADFWALDLGSRGFHMEGYNITSQCEFKDKPVSRYFCYWVLLCCIVSLNKINNVLLVAFMDFMAFFGLTPV